MKEKKTSQFSVVEMTEIVLPHNTNSLGTVFGGVVVTWVDIAAAICAQRHSAKQVVTASIDAMHFLAPIKLGWIVNIKAHINFVANSSCEVEIKITSENPTTRETYHTATAYVTMVALDSNGKPTSMPELVLSTKEERKNYEQAKERRKSRLLLKKNLLTKAAP